MTKIWVTGGAGYIGSHTCVELLNAGFEVVIVDNFYNSHPRAVERIALIAKREVALVPIDLLDTQALERSFIQHQPDAVIHFAGLKAVGESLSQPLSYYQNNVQGTLSLLSVMKRNGCQRLIFSSSATVYGVPETLPIGEDAAIRPTNPYGRSKAMVEQILCDMAHAHAHWKIALLRYFNPVGAHPSGLIGEDPQGIPNNLMPYIAQVASGKLATLTVYGEDYATRDGTGERDYLHVVDLARGHVAALRAIDQLQGATAINLGTGNGSTVLEMIAAFEKACGKKIPYVLGARRPGDIARCYADVRRAKELLNWETALSLEHMCADTWNWQKHNPHGYVADLLNKT